MGYNPGLSNQCQVLSPACATSADVFQSWSFRINKYHEVKFYSTVSIDQVKNLFSHCQALSNYWVTSTWNWERVWVCEWSWRSSGCRRRNVLKEDLVGRAAPLLLWAGELLWARFQGCEWGWLPGGVGWLEEDAVRVSPQQFFYFLDPAMQMGEHFLCLGPWVFTPSNPSRWAPVMGPGRQESNGDARFHALGRQNFLLGPFHPVVGEPNHSNWFLVNNSLGSPSMHLDGKELGKLIAQTK